jgi:uncharacterized protein (DUF2384 family)
VNPWDVGRLFRLYRLLLLVFEPEEAESWLMREQETLSGERPCATLTSTEGYYRVLAVVKQITESVHV